MPKNILLILILLISPVLASAESLTLDQCLARGLEFNPQVMAYRLAVDEAEEGIYEAWGAFLPTLSVDYGYSQLDNSGDVTLATDLSQQSESFSVRLSQPLFTGMAGVAGLKKARQSRTYREYELKYMQQQLVREIRTSFYDILHSGQMVDRWTESVGRLGNQQRIAKAWVDQELAPRLRLLEIDVELSNALQQLASAEASLVIAEAKLREWLAPQSDEPLAIEGSLPQLSLASCDAVETCLEQALNQRPELQLAELNISMAGEEAKSIRARNLPRISFDAGWTDYQRDFDRDDLERETRDYYTLSLNLSMRPFQGGRNIFAYRKQKLMIKRLEHDRVRQRNAITTEVRTRFQQLLAGDSRLSSATKGEAAAREAYLFADRATKLGISSLDDLLKAELRLTQAEISKIDAYHALQQAKVQLDYVVANQGSFD